MIQGERARILITVSSQVEPLGPADPDTLTAILLDPAGVRTTYTLADGDIVRASKGSYYLDHTFEQYTTTKAYAVRCEASGGLVAVGELANIAVAKSAVLA